MTTEKVLILVKLRMGACDTDTAVTWSGKLWFQTVRWRNLAEGFLPIQSQAKLGTARLRINIVGTGALCSVIVTGEVGATFGEYQV